ncbi:hypothetical protein ACLMAL_22390 [Nocardia sp. CWNU-33]|uniref:hypothetical protein n=1 Tax=Nocardia sp. CWNU-33 TaxID=3392117 RepID=UPI00398EB14F
MLVSNGGGERTGAAEPWVGCVHAIGVARRQVRGAATDIESDAFHGNPRSVSWVKPILPFVNPDQGGLLLAVASLISWGWVSVLALRHMPAFAAHVSWGAPHPA